MAWATDTHTTTTTTTTIPAMICPTRSYRPLRGTDGKRSAPGYLGAAIDPAGPAMDVLGNADPWGDLWFYANPIFVLPG